MQGIVDTSLTCVCNVALQPQPLTKIFTVDPKVNIGLEGSWSLEGGKCADRQPTSLFQM